MTIADHREREACLHQEALRPRRIFLILGGGFAVATLVVLYHRAALDSMFGEGFAYFYPLLLFLLIALGVFMVACYRIPTVGARLLGYAVVLEKEKAEALSYTRGFRAESASATKRQATRRLSARQARRRYTRQMPSLEKQCENHGELKDR